MTTDHFKQLGDILRPTDKTDLLTQYCALFEKIYGEQPGGNLSTFSEIEIQYYINDLIILQNE